MKQFTIRDVAAAGLLPVFGLSKPDLPIFIEAASFFLSLSSIILL